MDTLFFYLNFYANALIALCGFDGSAGSDVVGWVVVGSALVLVILAFYIGVTRAIWPEETDLSHIKYQILEDEESVDAH